MQFIGCGGFSAVYSATLRLPFLYANTELKVALKIVDDKVLNEVKLYYLSIPAPKIFVS
jgi:hypothetical protein